MERTNLIFEMLATPRYACREHAQSEVVARCKRSDTLKQEAKRGNVVDSIAEEEEVLRSAI